MEKSKGWMWRKSTEAWEKESIVIQKPTCLQPQLEPHPCTGLHAKAGSAPAGLPALPEVKLALPLQPWSRGLGVSGQVGKVTKHSLWAGDQRERPKDNCGSCHVNLAGPRC